MTKLRLRVPCIGSLPIVSIVAGLAMNVVAAAQAATLVGQWEFEGTWAATNDPAYDLVPGGGAHFVPSPYGTFAAAFGGGAFPGPNNPALDRADTVAQPTNASFSGGVTVMGWIKLLNNSGTPGGNFLSHDRSAFTTNELGLRVAATSNGTLALGVRDSDDRRLDGSSPIGTIHVGEWQHVGLTWDGSTTGGTQLYVDGAAVPTSISLMGAFAGLNSTGPLPIRVGADFDNSASVAGGYDGLVDHLSLWHGALTAAEVRADFDATFVPEPASWALLGTSLVGLLAPRRTKRRGR